MEDRKKCVLGFLLLFSTLIHELSALSITVNDIECVYEYVLYEGDTVSGNFVVVDHDIFWGSDHPGIDLIVSDFHSDLFCSCLFDLFAFWSLNFLMFLGFFIGFCVKVLIFRWKGKEVWIFTVGVKLVGFGCDVIGWMCNMYDWFCLVMYIFWKIKIK